MVRLIQMAGRAFRFSSSPKTLISLLQRSNLQIEQPLCNSLIQARNFISEMRKSAFEGNILRILRTEIQYESEYAPPKQIGRRAWVRLRRNYGDKENIIIEATMFDGDVSVPKVTEDGQGELRRDGMLARPYVGPEFKDLDDELQNVYQDFLEERGGVNDELAVFLHEYMVNKDKTEFVRWLGNVKSFIEK